MADSNTPNKPTPPPKAAIRALPGQFDWIRMHPSFSSPGISNSPSTQTADRHVFASQNHVVPPGHGPTGVSERPSRQPPNTPRNNKSSSYPDIFTSPSVNSNAPNGFERALHQTTLPANNSLGVVQQPRKYPTLAPAQSFASPDAGQWQRQFRASSSTAHQPTYRVMGPPFQHMSKFQSQPPPRPNPNAARAQKASQPQKVRRAGKPTQKSNRTTIQQERPSISSSLDADETESEVQSIMESIDPRLAEFSAETSQRRSMSRATSESAESMREDRIDDLSSDDEDYLEWRADLERKRTDKQLFKTSQRGVDGITARGGAKGLKGPRKAAEPTGDIKARLGEAAKAFLDENYDDAREICAEIIRINAETHEAWTTTASCFLETGQRAKALTAFGVAAHLQPKIIQGWLNLANLYLEDTGPNRSSYLSSAHFCYGAALKADSKHIESRLGKAKICVEWNKFPAAIAEYQRVLQIQPQNLQVIRDLCAAYFDNGELETAANLYKDTFAKFIANRYYYQHEALDWSDLDSYIAIYQQLNQHDTAIKELKLIARWMLDRASQSFWDDVTSDDREWDGDHSRRIDIPGFTEDNSLPSMYGDGLPLELRTKLGISRIGLGHLEEAMRHFQWLTGSDDTGEDKLLDYYDLYRQIADAYKASKLYASALVFYEPLKQIPEENTGDLYLQMGYCFSGQKSRVQAEECFQKAIQMDEDNIEARMELAKMYESLNEQEQAFIYVNEVMSIQNAQNAEQLAQRKRAPRKLKPKPTESQSEQAQDMAQVYRVLLPKEAVPQEAAPQEETFAQVSDDEDEAPKKPKHKPRRLADPAAKLADETILADQLQLQYRTLRRNHDQMIAGDRQAARAWMAAARDLTDDFRRVRSFYPYDKYIHFVGYRAAESAAGAEVPLDDEASIMAERLSKHLGADIADKTRVPQIEIPEDYRGTPFDEWLNIFLDFALCLARHGKKKESYEACEAAKDCALWYHNRDSLFLIQICWLTCALYLCDEEVCCNAARFFMKDYQFTTDSYRMFNAVTRMVNAPVTWYSSAPSQKFILRQIKAMDYALTTDPEARAKYFSEKGSYSAVDEKGQLIINDELDINLLMLYGHILYSSNSYIFSLNYFLRALALDPENAMINLNVGLAYVHHALRRQAENRQYLILQGTTFMFKYYNARKISTRLDERQEAHYNIARMYHLLGLSNLAMPYYNLVFKEAVDARKSGTEGSREGLVTDAAFNLQSIYVMAGNMELARKVTEKWLVI